MKFIILGGGLTGLSCALTLKKNGHEVVVLEKESEIGGLARCLRMDGYSFDLGPHFLFGKPVLQALGELLGNSLELKTLDSFLGKMYFRKRYFNFPFQPKDFLINLEPSWLPGVFFDLVSRGIRGSSNNNSIDCVEDWVINSVGKRIYAYTHLGDYISKLYGLSPRLVSKDWGVQKLKFLRNMNPFRLGVKTIVGSSQADKGRRIISYPPSGIDTISKLLAKSFSELGGETILGARALAVSRKGDREAIVDYISEEKKSSVKGDFLISTIPVDELTRMLTPAPEEDVFEAVTALKYRVLIALFLCVNKRQVTKHGCIYFSEKRFPFKRITEFTNLSEKMAPKDKTSLCVEITCFKDDEILCKDDKSIYDLVLTSLEQEGFLQRTEVEKYKVLRIPNAYPVYDLSYYKNLETVFGYLSTLKGIVSIGRQGLFSYNTMGNSIRSGLSIGKELSATDPSGLNAIVQARYQGRLEKYRHALRRADLRLEDVH
ncbi:MAG TPA: protoporphyrinogen/coproporphyrinogen oxidase [Candidatus Brocadiia bacterium]|nr:FAD-dependent oxidoreductase [Candidatus Brocadiales bacterium]